LGLLLAHPEQNIAPCSKLYRPLRCVVKTRPYTFAIISELPGIEEGRSEEELLQATENIIPRSKEDIMTAAQKLRKEGKMRGMQQRYQLG
jgi:hypothetical protein